MTQLDMLSPTTSPFDALRREDGNGEYWLARDLMPLLGYNRWDRVPDVVERASAAARNSGHKAADHFRASSDVADHGYARADYRLTRYGAYLVAMNGDPRKPEIALAQTYFAIKTREAEIGAAGLDDLDQLERITNAASQAIALARQERARAVVAETALAIAVPKANAWDVLASADGDLSVRRAAFVLNRDPHISTGQNRLFRWLTDAHWIDARQTPYADHAKHVRLRVYEHDGYTKQQVRITAEGLRLLHRRLGGTTPLAALMPAEGEDD